MATSWYRSSVSTPRTPLRAFLPLGQRIPLHASATGLAFLAAGPDEFVDGHVAGGLPPRTPRTITDPDTLRRTLDEIRTRGYSINDQGLSTGITAIGAAILDAHGQPVGSISVSGPTSRSPRKSLKPRARPFTKQLERSTRHRESNTTHGSRYGCFRRPAAPICCNSFRRRRFGLPQ
ncbi:IclR family transcriptional regulator [Nocardia sp. KC 131]|uniref:IclR family transcriptional regulator n=1 Tax=Nocardia arseniciresistens TaxID=3392119 RepID=UPI00398E6C9F